MKIPSSTWAAVGVLAATWAVPAVAEPPDARRRADMRQKHDASVREHAQELMQQLARDKDPEVRAHAATVLGKIKVVDAIPVLTTAVADGDPGVRAAAAGALWRLAPESRGAVPALEKALGDATPLVRLNAAGALNALDAGTPSKMAAVLGPLLSDADLAKSAAEVLVSTDLENADVRRYVLEGLTRGEGDVRKAIVLGMADARLSSEAARPYVPRLAEAIRADKAVEVRVGAVRVAQEIRPLPKELAAALDAALKDESTEVREAATQALSLASGDAQQRALEEALRKRH